MDVKLVCIGDEVFNEMVETIVRRIRESLPDKEDELVDFKTACKMLGCERTKLRELITNGDIVKQQKRAGTQIMITVASIKEYQRRTTQY